MQKVEVNVEVARELLRLSRADMADRLGIKLDRYNRLATGKSKMYVYEFARLRDLIGKSYNDTADLVIFLPKES